MSQPRRRVVTGTAAVVGTVVSSALAGCLTLSPRVEADLSDSAVFERVEVSESWATKRATARVSLTPKATRTVGVRRLVVVAGGSTVATVSVETGQTSVSNVAFPSSGRADLLALDGDGAPIEEVPVRVTGRVIP